MASATSKGVTKDKHGRHSKKCKAYKSANLRERHKLHNLNRHVGKQDHATFRDTTATAALKKLLDQFIKPLPNGKGLKFLGISY